MKYSCALTLLALLLAVCPLGVDGQDKQVNGDNITKVRGF